MVPAQTERELAASFTRKEGNHLSSQTEEVTIENHIAGTSGFTLEPK